MIKPFDRKLADSPSISRRAFATGLLLFPAGCAGVGSMGGASYGPISNDRFPIPGLDPSRNPELARQEVPFTTPYKPGTVVVKIPERRLYLVQPNGRAIRYALAAPRRSISAERRPSGARPSGQAGRRPST